MSGAALVASGLTKRYRRTLALRDCDFEVPIGAVVALVGPNGAGKSTLMSITAGLVGADSGCLTLLGEAIRPGRIHPQLGYLTQDRPLYTRFSVADMLRAGAVLNSRWDAHYAQQLVDQAGIPLSARIRALSGGQRTRVALALALGRRPSVLLLDEPVSDLDPVARQEIQQLLLTESTQNGTTIVLSSHVVSELDGWCDHLLLLSGGRLRLAGRIDEILSDHRVVGAEPEDRPAGVEVIGVVGSGTRSGALVRHASGAATTVPTLEELVVTYLRRGE